MRGLTSPVAVSATQTSSLCMSRLNLVKYSVEADSLSHCGSIGRRGSRLTGSGAVATDMVWSLKRSALIRTRFFEATSNTHISC